MTPTLSVARKEILSYFGSPLAFIAVGGFLAATLFTFFWVEAFFARGIADVRPLFAWMPLLVMLLAAALGMRQWSEEQRSGTLEILLTLPVRPIALVLGKFLAVQALVATALLLTLPLPVTVALLGDLDPGPVIGGYLASLLMAGAYAALALLLSSRTANQIVAFISTAVVGGALYLVGTPGVTDFAGGAGGLLRQLGTGSRFASIERGVLDLRDLVYYLSLTVGFLAAGVLALDARRWSRGAVTARYRRRALAAAALAAANLILLNVWLGPFARARIDLTADRVYSLSPATVSLLQGLPEPLLVRAYLSERTHPLLAPLAPQIADLLEEYRIAGRGAVTAEVIDPGADPQAEEEAVQRYGIRPTPFQVEDRFEQGIVNSYFDVVVGYGDQYEVLRFQDLISIDRGRSVVEVRLRNFEYDLTRAIKKASSGFRGVDSLFAALRDAAGGDPAELVLYVTPDTLPAEMDGPRTVVAEAARALAERSGGALVFRESDPGPDEGRQELADRYGLQPISVSLFSTQTYYFDLILEAGGQAFIVRPADEYSAASVTAAVESALKRAAPGFLRTIGVWLPPAIPTQDPFGRPQQPFASWQLLQQQLADDYAVQQVDLGDGRVPAQVDCLLIVAPQDLSEQERYAVDQYLMRGGALLVAAGSYRVDAEPYTGGLTLRRAGEGMAALLGAYGVTVAPSVVMDPQNEAFPTTVQSGAVLHVRAIDYPYFVDVRRDGMARTHPITASLEAVTLNWASPLAVDGALAADRQVDVLLHSTAAAWTAGEPTAQPDFDRWPDAGFARGGDQQEWPLAVAVTGRFDSAFAASGPPDAGAADAAGRRSMIAASPDDTRLVVFGSGEFLNDTIMSLSASLHGERYRNGLQLLRNAADWAVEDQDLLDIRSEGAVTRLLLPIDDAAERSWEVINYAAVALLLGVVGVVWWVRRRGERPMYGPPAGEAGP